MSLYVSASDLGVFREYRADEDFSFAQLMARLRRLQDFTTPEMLAGRAFHKVLEHIGVGETDHAEADGYHFFFQCDAELPLLQFHEIRNNREWNIGGEKIRLNTRADAFDGIIVDDHKLSKRFDAERYHDSYQWRAYLANFGAQRFNYNVFVGEPDEALRLQMNDVLLHGGEPPIAFGHVYVIDAFHRFTMYRYPELEDDVRSELGHFIKFAKEHLKERLAA